MDKHHYNREEKKKMRHPPRLTYRQKFLKIFHMIITGELRKRSLKGNSQRPFPDITCSECNVTLKQAWNYCVHCGTINPHFNEKAFHFLFNRDEKEFYRFECEILKHENSFILWEINGSYIYCFHCGEHLLGKGKRKE